MLQYTIFHYSQLIYSRLLPTRFSYSAMFVQYITHESVIKSVRIRSFSVITVKEIIRFVKLNLQHLILYYCTPKTMQCTLSLTIT